MKRTLFFIFILSLTSGFAAAQSFPLFHLQPLCSACSSLGGRGGQRGHGFHNDGIGFTTGLEFGVEINSQDTSNSKPYAMPSISYGNSFFDDALDVYTELAYIFNFVKDGNYNPQYLYFNLALAYNLDIGDYSILSFHLENENKYITLYPWENASESIEGVIKPGIGFSHNVLFFGDFFGQIDIPLWYMQEFDFGLNFTAGWKSRFGLALQITERNMLKPNTGYSGIDIAVSYTTDSFYTELEVNFPSDKSEGITITPYIKYHLKKLSFYVFCIFGGIGDHEGTLFTPGLGINYYF